MKTIQNLTTKEHFTKYDNLVKDHRLTNFKLPFKVTMESYSENKHLNSIPLTKWDMATFSIHIKGLSLAEKVCILKHIAIYHILKLTPKFK